MFRNAFNINPLEIIGHGDSNYNGQVTDNILQCGLVPKIGSIHKQKAYKCFGAIDHFKPERIIANTDHIDGKSSWDCLMAIMGKPKYLIIQRIKKGERSKSFKSLDDGRIRK